MRVLRFVDIVIVSALVAAYQLNSEPRLPQPSTSQSKAQESVLESLLAEKSDRLVSKEEEQLENQVFSAKLVRLEKYDLPADDDVNSHGSILVMMSGAVYEVLPGDNIDSALWLPPQDVLICEAPIAYQGRTVLTYVLLSL